MKRPKLSLLRTAIVLSLVVAGCVGTDDAPNAADGSASEADAPTGPAWPIPIVDHRVEGAAWAGDQEFAPGSDLPRTERRIVQGTERLLIWANWSETVSGVRVGYSIDGGEWTYVSEANGELQVVEIAPDQWEQERRRWRFRWDPSSPAGSVGASGGGEWSVRIHAVGD